MTKFMQNKPIFNKSDNDAYTGQSALMIQTFNNSKKTTCNWRQVNSYVHTHYYCNL